MRKSKTIYNLSTLCGLSLKFITMSSVHIKFDVVEFPFSGHVLSFCCCQLCLGVDFKIKLLTVAGKRLKLTIWDTGKFF